MPDLKLDAAIVPDLLLCGAGTAGWTRTTDLRSHNPAL